MSAWPIDTSARCGSVRNSVRLARSRSWPALTSRPRVVRESGRGRVPLEARLPVARAAGERVRERLGVELDPLRADRRRPLHRRWLGIDEEADAYAIVLQLVDDRAQPGRRRVRRPPGLAGDLPRANRDERALVRPDRTNQIEQIGPRIAFDVELDAVAERRELLGDFVYVSGRDVTRVSARVHGDARRAVGHAHAHRVDDARNRAAARVAQRRHLVDVDAQTRAVRCHHPR